MRALDAREGPAPRYPPEYRYLGSEASDTRLDSRDDALKRVPVFQGRHQHLSNLPQGCEDMGIYLYPVGTA